jgi:hypothetical protein
VLRSTPGDAAVDPGTARQEICPAGAKLPRAAAREDEAQPRIAVEHRLRFVEQTRQLLDLIDNDEPLVGRRGLAQRLGEGAQLAVYVGFEQIDIVRLRKHPPEERALPRLSRPEQEQRTLFDERPEMQGAIVHSAPMVPNSMKSATAMRDFRPG